MNEEIGTRIVCAAVNVKWPDGKKIQLVGVRHWDYAMQEQFQKYEIDYGLELLYSDDEQGFLTNEYDPTVNNYRFVTRTEAWKIAEAAEQIIRRCGGDDIDGGTLYSENLY